MSVAAWPAVVMVGAWIVIVGGVFGIFGIPAALVRNDRLSDALVLFACAPLVALGVVVVIVGALGWWAFVVVGALSGFGWLVRPRRRVQPWRP